MPSYLSTLSSAFSVFVALVASGQSVLPVDPFTAGSPFQTVTEEQNLSLPVQDSSIFGGLRDLYIRSFNAGTDISYTFAIEGGALSYTPR